MGHPSGIAALLVLAVAASQVASASGQLSLVIFTERGWGNIDFLKDAMTKLGVRADVKEYWRGMGREERPDMKKLMRTADGARPAYAGFAMYPNIEAMGYLNRSEVEDLWAFQREFQARSVKFGAWPTYFGFTPTDKELCSSEANPLAGASADALRFTSAAPYNLTGVQLSTKFLEAKGLYRCPGLASKPLPTCSIWGQGSDFETSGLHPNCTSRPIMEFVPKDAAEASPSTGLVAAMLVEYEEGYPVKRESMAYVFDCSGWSYSCQMLGNLSVAWMVERWGVDASAAVPQPGAAAGTYGGLVPPPPYNPNQWSGGYSEQSPAGLQLASQVVASFIVKANSSAAAGDADAPPPKPAGGGAGAMAGGGAGGAAAMAAAGALLLSALLA